MTKTTLLSLIDFKFHVICNGKLGRMGRTVSPPFCWLRVRLQVITVVYFDQLLGAVCTQKLVGTLFFSHFQLFFFFSNLFLVISHLKSLKNVWKWTKKLFFFYFLLFFKAGWIPEGVPWICNFTFRCAQHPKAGRNTQHIIPPFLPEIDLNRTEA